MMFTSTTVTTLVTLFAAALVGTSHARLGLSNEEGKNVLHMIDGFENGLPGESSLYDGPIRRTLAMVTFETDQDMGNIDRKQVEIAESVLKSSCNHAHPSDEVDMLDVAAKSVSRERIASSSEEEEHLEGYKYNWYYSYVFQANIGCNLCRRFGNEEYLAGKVGHLNEWEVDYCGAIPYATNCKIIVAYEHEHTEDSGSSSLEISRDGYNQIPHDHVHTPLPALPEVSTNAGERITTDVLAVVTFKTKQDLGPIDTNLISNAEHVLRDSCNKAHPENEVYMYDDSMVYAHVAGISSSSSEEYLEGKYYYKYSYVFQANIGCNLCRRRLGATMLGNDDEKDLAAAAEDEKGHLKQWTAALCDEFGDDMFDCHITVAFEDDVAADTIVVESVAIDAVSMA